jgi:hypothetical protein
MRGERQEGGRGVGNHEHLRGGGNTEKDRGAAGWRNGRGVGAHMLKCEGGGRRGTLAQVCRLLLGSSLLRAPVCGATMFECQHCAVKKYNLNTVW